MRRNLGRAVRVGVALAIAAAICGGCRTAGPPSAFTSTAKTSMSGGSQIESTDPTLRDSLARIALLPSAAAHRDAAAAYLQLGIRDKAYDHLERAVTLDPKDASAHDGLARLWRDWGFPEHGMADAQRAVKYAPASPVVFNTLGTLYEAMGLQHEARQAYWRAVELDSHAEYALANLTRLLTVQLSEARRTETPAPTDARPMGPTPKKETP